MELVKTMIINTTSVKGNVRMLDNSQNKNVFTRTNELPIRFHRLTISRKQLSKI